MPDFFYRRGAIYVKLHRLELLSHSLGAVLSDTSSATHPWFHQIPACHWITACVELLLTKVPSWATVVPKILYYIVSSVIVTVLGKISSPLLSDMGRNKY